MSFLAVHRALERRRSRARGIPSRAVRRAQSAREPKAAALALTRDTHARLAQLEGHIERLLFPALDRLVGERGELRSLPDDPNARTRVDARLPSYITARLSAIELHLLEIFNERDLDDALDVIGKRVSKKNARELHRVIGISIRDADPGVAELIENFRAINVSRIKSLAGRELVEITQLLESSEATGSRVEVLRKVIQDRFSVTRSKATLLARDQTLTLNSQIARQRQQNAGIVEYIWTTSADERVRAIHAEREGKRYRWDTPPEDGHPGEPIQCRCTAFPVLPALA